MEERILSGKKNGMPVLLLTLALYIAAVAGVIFGAMRIDGGRGPLLFIVSMAYVALGWIPLCGLKVVGPQEALVLTLFGKYYGSIKENGFYFVNPFCTAVNPAAETRLNQSGDVDNPSKKNQLTGQNGAQTAAQHSSKKISLKAMTLNNSRQKLLFLTYGESDFIFAVICEELGFVGGLVILLAYGFIIFRGIRIALRCRDRFGSLLAAGITIVFAIQILVNIGVVTGSFPTTGQALPFISSGGSSLVLFLAAMGVLLNISRSTSGSMQPVVRAAFRKKPRAVAG